MSNESNRHKHESLAKISATITLPYLWIALLVGLYWLWNSGVLVGIVGIIIIAVIGLAVLKGSVPRFMASTMVQPFFYDLLEKDQVPARGCVSGLVTFLVACFGVLFFIGRDLQLAGIMFFGAPVFALLVTLIVTLLVRSGIFKSHRTSRPPQIKVEEPKRPPLPPPQSRGEISQPPKSGAQLTGPNQPYERASKPGRPSPPRRRD